MGNIEKITLVEPNFDCNLTELILALDYLKKKEFVGSTPDNIFSQLKHLFHMLESIGFSRI